MNRSAAATFIGAMHATYPDQRRFCRFLRREIIQVVWLPSPAVRNGEWIVIWVVAGDFGCNRPDVRRGLFGGKHGQVFTSNMHRPPRPYPAGQRQSHRSEERRVGKEGRARRSP